MTTYATRRPAWVLEVVGGGFLIGHMLFGLLQDMRWETATPLELVVLGLGLAGHVCLFAAATERYGKRYPPGEFSWRFTATTASFVVPRVYWGSSWPGFGVAVGVLLAVVLLFDCGPSVVAHIRRGRRAADWWEGLPERPYVYLVQGGSLYKIGRTSSLPRRIHELQNMSGARINVRLVWPADDAASLEYMLHKRFGNQRVYGEWFALTPQDLRWLDGLPPAIGLR